MASRSSLRYNQRTMVHSASLLVFLSAALLLAIAPGPGMLYVLARTLAGGRREGLFSSLGTFLGGTVHVLAAAVGVSIILARSAAAFATVKYLGAAYLYFLGLRMIHDARKDSDIAVELPARSNPFWQGVATEVLNPKTALFFLSLSRNLSIEQAATCFCNSWCWERYR